MSFYLILILLLILVISGPGIWCFKIFKYYQEKKTKKAIYHTIISGLICLIICWELRLIPLAHNVDFRNQTEELTGKTFWCWNDYRYNEIGIRGEGFTFEIYKLNDEMANYFTNPDKGFFEYYPNKKFETGKWQETPIIDTEFLNYITPIYGNWSKRLKKEIEEKQMIVKQISNERGSYFAIRETHGTDLYLISPKKKLIIYINHNM